MTKQELVRVEFHGDVLEAVKANGKVWVSLRRCCENLGVADDTQRRKLKGKAWACTTEMVVHDSSGREQTATMIDLDTLPGWLFSIDARKVKESLREKLARYQREAARALADHFFGRGDRADRADAVAALTAESIREIIREEVAAHRLALASVRPLDDLVTVEDRLRQRGVSATPEFRRRVRDVAVALHRERLGRHPYKLTGARNGTIAFEREHLRVLDDAIDIMLEEVEQAQFVPLFRRGQLADA